MTQVAEFYSGLTDVQVANMERAALTNWLKTGKSAQQLSVVFREQARREGRELDLMHPRA